MCSTILCDRCVCNIDCSHISFNPVCASDGHSYDNPCQVKEASCQKQERIEVKYLGHCQGDIATVIQNMLIQCFLLIIIPSPLSMFIFSHLGSSSSNWRYRKTALQVNSEYLCCFGSFKLLTTVKNSSHRILTWSHICPWILYQQFIELGPLSFSFDQQSIQVKEI